MSMAMAQILIQSLKSTKQNLFSMCWKGSKIPRGGKVGGIEIVWSQHGIVTGANGVDLGFYERKKEWGGVNRDEHQILISTNYESATNPDGTDCPMLSLS